MNSPAPWRWRRANGPSWRGRRAMASTSSTSSRCSKCLAVAARSRVRGRSWSPPGCSSPPRRWPRSRLPSSGCSDVAVCPSTPASPRVDYGEAVCSDALLIGVVAASNLLLGQSRHGWVASVRLRSSCSLQRETAMTRRLLVPVALFAVALATWTLTTRFVAWGGELATSVAGFMAEPPSVTTASGGIDFVVQCASLCVGLLITCAFVALASPAEFVLGSARRRCSTSWRASQHFWPGAACLPARCRSVRYFSV